MIFVFEKTFHLFVIMMFFRQSRRLEISCNFIADNQIIFDVLS